MSVYQLFFLGVADLTDLTAATHRRVRFLISIASFIACQIVILLQALMIFGPFAGFVDAVQS